MSTFSPLGGCDGQLSENNYDIVNSSMKQMLISLTTFTSYVHASTTKIALDSCWLLRPSFVTFFLCVYMPHGSIYDMPLQYSEVLHSSLPKTIIINLECFI